MGKSFQEKVYQLTQLIPKGKVATYQQLARMAGSPHGARAVGMCMSKNKNPQVIPCHRVVASGGKLTGYAFGGIYVKKQKLIEEGVSFIRDHVDLSVSQWQPQK